MVKYLVKMFDDNDNLKIQLIIDGDSLFDICEHYSDRYVVKANLLNED